MRHVLALVLLLVATGARAQLSGSVSATTVMPGEIFNLTITAEGSQVGTPILPDAPDFNFLNANNPSIGTGSKVEIINGSVRQSQSKSWTYNIKIDKEGSFTLPPLRVIIDSKEFTTQPLQMTVSKTAQPQRQPRRRSPFDQFMDPFAGRPNAAPVNDSIPFEDSALFELTVDRTEVYQGEPIAVTLVYGKLEADGVQISGDEPQLVHPQSFFLGSDEPNSNVRTTHNNNRYITAPRRQVWFPTQPGNFNIPSMEWPVTISRINYSGTDRRTIMKKTEPVTVIVKPLPPAPPDFSGAVGNMTITTSLPGNELLQGSPVQLVVKVNGQGNPSAISPPEIPPLDWAHVSAATAEQNPEATQGALKVFSYTLTPLREGLHQVPELHLTYFSPSSGTYVPTTAQAISINVRKAVEAPMVVVGGPAQTPAAAVNRVPAQINPILADVGPLEHEPSRWLGNTLVAVAPPLLYALLFLFVRHRRRLRDDKDFARDYFARSKSHKRLARVLGAKDPSDELFRAVAGFVADKLHVEEAGMTSVDARQAVVNAGLDADLAVNIEKILRACERARYAGAQHSKAELGALLDAARQAMDQLEAGLKKGGAA